LEQLLAGYLEHLYCLISGSQRINMNSQWLKDRAINTLIYGTLILGIGFMLYSAFLKPTQKFTAQKGSNIYVSNADKEVPIMGCSVYKVKAKIVWQ
jgi:hypothetical protein